MATPDLDTLAPGFDLQPVGQSNRWYLLSCLKCPKSVRFVNASPDRATWYMQIHRHGPTHTGWNAIEPAELAPPDGMQRTNLMNALCFASRLIEQHPRQLFDDPTLYVAGEALAGQLETALAYVNRSRLRIVTGGDR